MERDSFVFYRSFAECIRELDPSIRCDCYDAIVDYALDGVTPKTEGVVSAMFKAFKPQIDANNRRFENGRKGGRPKVNQEETKTKPKVNQNKTNPKPNVNVNVNENVNVNIYKHIRDMFNETCVSFPKVQTLSEKRKKALSARLKVYTEEDFKTLFTKAEASSFLKGQNGRNWVATFDWLICDANMAKVLDGNYDDHKPIPKKNAFNNFQQTTHDFDELEKMLIAN